ncbi:DUF6300 family protein [Streptomyces sp. NPDC048281]|uniref:DUF6300 family protein n=1 Tax=Streptomyces sp. NPDC048281 TaxID=3154715 RepID=UPI003417C4ED
MSFSWRYHVHPDGSFARLGNADGSLDHYTDDQLARLCSCARRDPEDPPRTMPDCSRCGGALTLYWNAPLITGVMMELCPACDGARPAAAAFIRWHRDPDREPQAVQGLFEAWEEETLNAHGWYRAADVQAPPAPPLPPELTPRGHG